MDGAFVLATAKRRSVDLAGRMAEASTRASPGFAPRHHVAVESIDRQVRLECWHAEAEQDGGTWAVRSSGTTFVVGDLRSSGQSWGPPSGWAAHLADDVESRPAAAVQQALQGVFLAGHLDVEGRGWVVSDGLGMRCLYWGENEELVAVSSRAALVAQLLSRGGSPPKDADSAAWLPFAGHRFGERTGYVGVRLARPGDRLSVEPGRVRWTPTNPLVVAPDHELRGASLAELAERVELDVGEALRHALAHPADRHVVRLTGGKDSRLLLAIVVRAGLADAFAYETVGPPDHPDVRIAAELCAELGLRHEAGFLGATPARPYEDRFRHFVDATAGLVNGAEMSRPAESQDLQLTGLGGEPLRRYAQLTDEQLADPTLQLAFPRRRFGRLDLVRADVADVLYREVRHRLDTEPSAAADPLDRVHALFAGGRMRFARFGAREELEGSRRVHPLYSAVAVQAAMAMDPADRCGELLFAEVMRRASPKLVAVGFANSGWGPRARRHLAGEADGVSAPTTAAPVEVEVPSAPPVMAQIAGTASAPRVDLLTEVLADATNPAWGVLDRDRAIDALGRYSELTNRQRHELLGAATMAVWLAD